MTNNPLDKIVAPPRVETSSKSTECVCESDADTELIAKSHAHNELERKRKEAEEHIADSQQNRAQRKEYAEKIFWLVCGWLAALVVTIWKTGRKDFELSDTVLVAIISGASVNIIGLMVIVANYLFPKNGPPKQEAVKDKK